jgi:hypothetical protein
MLHNNFHQRLLIFANGMVVSSASFAVEILRDTTAKPPQGIPGELATLGLDPALPSCEMPLT